MTPRPPFKVVIVGGSVAGLSLANMLQANKIDYVVLEAYPTIAPQVGASLGLLPHGNRILDQLGVFDEVLALSTPIDTFTFRDDTGHPIAACHGVSRSFNQRHGFPIIFLDRQMVLQILYDKIQDKSKVMTGRKVTKVELGDNEAVAITADGSRYRGDIIIGADGVHSTVRGQMWKLADKLNKGLFETSEADEVVCDYHCLFGISTSCPGVNPGDMNSVFRDKASYLVIGGSKGRTYWFRFRKFPRRLYGSQVPRFSQADTDRYLKEAMNEYIFPNVKFSALIEKKISVSSTTLVEHVYKRWHFDRLMTVGDSCHKFHPIGGHGGNGAIETAATLTNLLVEKLNVSLTGHLTGTEIDDLFSSVQDLRYERTLAAMDYSHQQQRIESLDSLFKRFSAFYLLPLVDNEDVTFNFSCQIPASEKLEMLPVQRGERLIPYKDELLSEPKRRGLYQWLLIAIYVGFAAVVYYGMWVLPEAWGLIPAMGEVLQTGTFKANSSFELLRSYTGVSALDQYLTFLAVIFMPGLRAWSLSYRTLQVYFLGLIAQPIAIWTVESCRKRNSMTLLAFPSIWFALFQSTGIGFYMPLYYAAYTWISDVEPYWWPLQRVVPIQHAKSLLSSSLIGYVLPTILMFIPWKSDRIAQYWETFWQPSPLFVPLLTTAFGVLYRWQRPLKPDEKLTPLARDEPVDVGYLKQVYSVMGILGVLVHWYVVLGIFSDDQLSFAKVFIPNLSANPMPLYQGFQNIFLIDFWGFFAASYVWCVSAVWDLKRVGRTTVSTGNSALVIAAANLAFGPGAAMCAGLVLEGREDGNSTFPNGRKAA
ncbi:hypothetical protein NM208_g9280 [Fusarium decemcellulare]|uniref:Uncharacterized protein n=1 Tax=Fusarium decemcellulare TaxID=57161 RepID=A0ACC1S264_9HYPO|nr:hypothetical protein NM208_g9280 [Fusarium decemcellulare]